MSTRIQAVVSMLLVLGCCLPVVAQERVERIPMRFGPPVGVQTQVDLKIETEMKGLDLPDAAGGSVVRVVVNQQVAGQEGETYRITATVADASMSVVGMEAEQAEISTDAFSSMLGRLKQQQLEYTMNSSGQIELPPTRENETVSNDMLQSLTGLLREMVGRLTGYYKHSETFIGDSWEDEREEDLDAEGMKLHVQTRSIYKVVGFQTHQGRSIPEIEVQVSIKQTGGSELYSVMATGQGTGRTIIDPLLGLPIKSNLSMDMNQSVSMQGSPEKMGHQLRITSVVTGTVSSMP